MQGTETLKTNPGPPGWGGGGGGGLDIGLATQFRKKKTNVAMKSQSSQVKPVGYLENELSNVKG